MQTEDFDIRSYESSSFDLRDNLRKRRYIAARENVLRDPGIGRPRSAAAADCVQQRHSILFKQCRNLGEVFAVMSCADMFEHADGHDPVKPAGLVAVITQLETDAASEFFADCARAGVSLLIYGKCQTGDIRSRGVRKIHPQPAPT